GSSPRCRSRPWTRCGRSPDPTPGRRWYRPVRAPCSPGLTLGPPTMRFRSDAPHERVTLKAAVAAIRGHMTRTTNAKIAGFTYLFYIAVAFPSMVLFDRATSGEGMGAKLASMAQHATDVRLAVVLSLLGCFCALVLAVTLS